MTTLDVYLEGHGLVGKLSSDEMLAVTFAYTGGYSGPALSLSLPVRTDPFGDVASRAFFHNLLQEGWRLEKVAAQHRIERNDRESSASPSIRGSRKSFHRSGGITASAQWRSARETRGRVYFWSA